MADTDLLAAIEQEAHRQLAEAKRREALRDIIEKGVEMLEALRVLHGDPTEESPHADLVIAIIHELGDAELELWSLMNALSQASFKETLDEAKRRIFVERGGTPTQAARLKHANMSGLDIKNTRALGRAKEDLRNYRTRLQSRIATLRERLEAPPMTSSSGGIRITPRRGADSPLAQEIRDLEGRLARIEARVPKTPSANDNSDSMGRIGE